MSQLLVTTPEKVCLQLPKDSQLYSADLLPGVSHHFCYPGGYKILADRLPEYIVPDLTGFKVRHGCYTISHAALAT